MPRLTNSDYYRRHRFLQYLWQRYQNLFALVDIEQQYDLHNFYRPDKYFTKADLIAYRQDIRKEDPALPARASRAYIRLHQAYQTVIVEHEKKKEGTRRRLPKLAKRRQPDRISVRSVVRPEPDWDRFAYALLQMAKLKVKNITKL